MTRLAPLLCVLLLASPAGALPLPLAEPATLGRPAITVSLEISASADEVTIRARAGAREASASVRAPGIDDATVEAVEVAPGHHVAIVRASGASRAAALVAVRGGVPVIPWSARTDHHGDPGERLAGRVEVADRTGDGRPNVIVGLVREGATICGQQETLLSPRAWDPGRATLRPVVLTRLGDGEELALVARSDSPGPSSDPLVRVLRPTGASSTWGQPDDAPDAFAPPAALFDGRPDTYWAEGRGGPGAHEFVTATYAARLRVRAFAVVLSPAADAARTLGRPRRFWLVGDRGPRLRVEVPDGVAAPPGGRLWVVPPEPLSWSCVSLVLDEARAPDGTSPAAVHTAVAELEAFTDLDWGEGVEVLVAMLVEGGARGDEAAHLLGSLGTSAITAIGAAWERLDLRGQLRAVRAVASATQRGGEGGVPLLERAARADADEVARAATEALGGLGADAGEALSRLVVGPRGDVAVAPLLRHSAELAVPALLAAIVSDGGSERPALREGLAQAVGGREAARAALARWIEQAPPAPARAAAALGLASRADTRELAAPILRGLAPEATRFEDRWRLVRGAALLGADPEIDAWLATLARDADEWMLRAAAMGALRRRDAPSRAAVARALLADRYPRVRVAAIETLDALDADDEGIAARARRDSWPMVRAAAVTALFDRPAGREAVRRAVDDRSPRVRHAAIGALTRGGVREALPLVTARLEDRDEWPRVTEQALRWVEELCVEEAGEAVLTVLRRGARSEAWAPDVDLAALAGDLAMRLGGATAREAETIARRGGTPELVRAAIERRARDPRPCRPRAAERQALPARGRGVVASRGFRPTPREER
ncbi:MAG: HEAT repeat domain-containing protein [Sandaracinaceae bacterium]|nr:HEAT repeat domain-containing protein [Sandaracinaceae bacterium]